MAADEAIDMAADETAGVAASSGNLIGMVKKES